MAEQRSLFRVYVVNPKGGGKVLLDGKCVIADNSNQATLKAGVAAIAEQEGLDLEQIDVYAEHVAQFVRPRRETQKVRIAKEDEE